MKKINFEGILTAQYCAVKFLTSCNARGEKGRQIAARIKQFLINLGLQYFGQPIIFTPSLPEGKGVKFQGEITPPAPKWAQIKDALSRASNSKN